jgi:proline dehydrogenase
MALRFANTEIAFRSKSDADLRRADWIFRSFGHPWFVKAGMAALRSALALHLPVERPVKATVFRQFVGGETIAECGPTIAALWRHKVGTILDVADEGREGEAESDATMAEVERTIDLAAGNPAIPFCVFKMSGLARVSLLEKLDAGAPLDDGERAEWSRARARVERLCARAHAKGVRILIDAEESWIQDTIDALATEMMARFNREKAVVYNTIQSYRRDGLGLVHKSQRLATEGGYWLGLKLVRGAYMEKERARAAERGLDSPILPDKAASDASYDEALRFCVERIGRIAIVAGTHNERSTLLLTDLMDQHGLRRDDQRLHFSQLLGMSDHLSYNLAAEGYNVCKYVPYGPVRAVVPYLMRRAEENTSMRGQIGRERALVLEERQRRRSALK